MGEPVSVELERWGADPRLEELLGAQGAAEFRALLDGFPDAVGIQWALRDASGRIEDFAFGYGNPAMLRRFRLPAATAERYTLLQALPQMRGRRAFDAYCRVCETGEPSIREIVYDTPFGDGYMFGTFIQRVAKLGDGLVIVLTDVTEERRMEAELRSFADLVAHDLREPITGIAHLVTLLARHPDEPPPEEVLQLLGASVDRARALIDGVLEYARAGDLRHEPVALDVVLSEVADDLRPFLEEADATLRAERLPEVEGDPRQLRRLLQNLVANAVRFRGPDPPRIEVSATPRDDEWVVTVSDNGIGIDRAQRNRIFDMFARAGADGGDGTGIGLAVCRRVVESHGGRIWVEPAEGGGSAFRFSLPR